MIWAPADTAPDDAWPLAIAARITRGVHAGKMLVLSGGRVAGDWHIEPCLYAYEITHFIALPVPPGRRLS